MPSSSGLSILPDDWDTVRSALEGVTWQVTFCDSRYRDSVPSKAGIYLLVIREQILAEQYSLPRDLRPVVYVGRTTDLRRRLREHTNSVKNPIIRTCRTIFGTLRYVFATVPEHLLSESSEWLQEVEAILVHCLDPPANRVIPTRTGVSGKLGPAVRLG